jgi:hypothetical protein
VPPLPSTAGADRTSSPHCPGRPEDTGRHRQPGDAGERRHEAPGSGASGGRGPRAHTAASPFSCRRNHGEPHGKNWSRSRRRSMKILARGRREWRGAPASTSWLQISKAEQRHRKLDRGELLFPPLQTPAGSSAAERAALEGGAPTPASSTGNEGYQPARKGMRGDAGCAETRGWRVETRRAEVCFLHGSTALPHSCMSRWPCPTPARHGGPAPLLHGTAPCHYLAWRPITYVARCPGFPTASIPSGAPRPHREGGDEGVCGGVVGAGELRSVLSVREKR